MKQFLGFYRPAVAMGTVDLAAIAEYELKLVENQLHKRKIEVVRKLTKVPNVVASEDQMKQVFLNLILNAIEAMPSGGTLTVETHREMEDASIASATGAVAVTIGDTGAGIQPDHLRSLFEPFFTTKTEKGTGLGLFVSYGIVKAHKGTIRVETQPGVGTRFHVILPAG
jgi:two-component system NtrC family sensor kinase